MTSTGEEEQEQEKQQEPKHPGWEPLSGVPNATDPFFEKFLVLRSFDTFSSNIYLIMGDYLTIVDPGNDYTAFMDLFNVELRAARITPANIKKVVLTHGHPDHAMGALELLRYPAIVEGGGFELILHEAAPSQFKEILEQSGSGYRVTEVRGGETLELSGLEWEVIHTPGHTIDGICLYHAPTKTVFTGDMVLPHAMAEPDKHAGGRLDHYLFGLKALLKRDIENVLPGHGLPVVSGGRRVIEETYEGVMMKIIGIESETKASWMQGATALAQRGLLEEAVFCCEKEIACHPENLKAFELKAMCLNDLGRSSEALEAFDKVLAQKGDNAFALTGKGCALLGLGKYNESLSYFENALRIEPRMKEAQVYKGVALYLSGKYDEAMDIQVFRTEFVGRFKEELLKKGKPATA
jgi:glyoxylase-like metal-dependent hydrolase (beta-lactamase superfamily II)